MSDRWRNTYDRWKLASPYDDWEEFEDEDEEPPEDEWMDESWEEWEPVP